MADNYLERQYETYQARKAAWEREKRLGKKKKGTGAARPNTHTGHHTGTAPDIYAPINDDDDDQRPADE